MIVDEPTFKRILESLDQRIKAINEAEANYIKENSTQNFNEYLMNYFENKSDLFNWEKEILPKLNENFPHILRLIIQNLCVDDEVLEKFKLFSDFEKKILIKNLELTTRIMKINHDINKKSKIVNPDEDKVFESFKAAIQKLNEIL
jgi:hypothetical protein